MTTFQENLAPRTNANNAALNIPAAMHTEGSALSADQRADCAGCFNEAAMAAFAGQDLGLRTAQANSYAR